MKKREGGSFYINENTNKFVEHQWQNNGIGTLAVNPLRAYAEDLVKYEVSFLTVLSMLYTEKGYGNKVVVAIGTKHFVFIGEVTMYNDDFVLHDDLFYELERKEYNELINRIYCHLNMVEIERVYQSKITK